MKDFEGRVIVITGAARGIGRAMALELIARGASVASIDLRRDEADVDGLQTFVGDVSDPVDMVARAEEVVARFGHVDGLVCNAAVYAGLTMRRFEDIDPAEWDKVMAVNVRGVWATCRAFAGSLRAAAPAPNGDASIVTVASAAAFTGETGVLHYVASKGAGARSNSRAGA